MDAAHPGPQGLLMMAIDPTCRFCFRRLTLTRKLSYDICEEFLCWCSACKSKQVFDANAKPLYWSFEVGGTYRVYFWPDDPLFNIFLIDGSSIEGQCVLRMTTIPPNITPQNTTVERIKTWILFS